MNTSDASPSQFANSGVRAPEPIPSGLQPRCERLATGTPRPRAVYGLAIGLVLLATACLPADLWITRRATSNWLGGDFRKALALSEAFAHGFGVAMILLVVWVLERRRRCLARAIACAAGAGLLADVAKLVVGRTRPNFAKLEADVWSTFTGWAPALHLDRAGELVNHSVQSFPSGHAATAVGLAIGLSWLYPRGRWVFVALAAMAGLQRIAFGHHFLTDVLAGAALGCVVGAICTDSRGLGGWFDRFERRVPFVRATLEADPGQL